MASVNWKVSGVVQDSEEEDDGFDSAVDSELPPAAANYCGPYNQGRLADGQVADIWDVPHSSYDAHEHAGGGESENNQLPTTSPQSSPLSSVPDDNELFGPQHVVPRTAVQGTVVKRLNSRVHQDGSPDPLLGVDDHNSTSHGPSIEPHAQTPYEEKEDRPATPSFLPWQHSLTPMEAEALKLTRRAAVGPAANPAAFRSLRPRKPIQQNPYLIESAQYFKALKDHGLRPVRIYQEEVARQGKVSRDDISQDQEFEDESQNTVGGDSGTGWQETSASRHFSQGEQNPDSSPPAILPRSSGMRMASWTDSDILETGDTNPASTITASDDEELPSIDDILRRTKKTVPTKRHKFPSRHLGHKRRLRTKTTAPQLKEPRLSSPQAPQQIASSPSLERQRISDDGQHYRSGQISVDLPQRAFTPEAGGQMIDLTLGDTHDLTPSVYASSSSSTSVADNGCESASESGSDILQYGQKARGVLPASHFRLDRATNQRRSNQKQLNRYPGGSMDLTPKRGVAVRTTRSRPTNSHIVSMHDLEDDVSDTDMMSSLPQSPGQSRAPRIVDIHDRSSEDDQCMEEAAQLDISAHTAYQGTKSHLLHNAKQQPGHRVRLIQPKITHHLTRDPGLSTGNPHPHHAVSPTRQKQAKAPRKRKPPQISAPRLGILDVISSDAPKFLKIAARTVIRKKGKGRSSPNRKTLFFATREDQLDAGTCLLEWKQGRIQPRTALPTPSKPRRILSPVVNARHLSRTPSDQRGHPRLLGDSKPSVSLGSAHLSHSPTTPRNPTRSAHTPARSRRPIIRQRRLQLANVARPAQLEDDSGGKLSRLAFDKHKRVLDTLYRHNNRPLSPLSITSDHGPTYESTQAACILNEAEPAVSDELSIPVTKKASRAKKAHKPNRIDIMLAQYVHAHDPLPITRLPDADTSETGERSDGVLTGLGPFGTHYSYHFEVFPLQTGIYFHEDTLIGGGCIDASTDVSLVEKICQHRPRVFLSVHQHLLKWSVWTDSVSSELGLLVDVIWQNLTRAKEAEETSVDARTAAQFVWQYILNSFSISDDSQVRGFVARIHEVMNDLLDRLEAKTIGHETHQEVEIVEVLSHCLVAVISTLTICQHRGATFSDRSRMELLLARLSKMCVSRLLRVGLQQVTNLYDDCQRLSFRERGIRHDNVSVQAWVLLMRGLGHLQIPKYGFWDILSSVLIQPQYRVCSDAHVFEELWRTVFVLLPLCEFDNSGVVVPGARYELSTDGWALPQLILKRTFNLYKINNRQQPGFNSYCRALIGRCHYLVDQWGWLRSGGVIGIIFDFFASLNLSHLRNEGACQSADFLEHLDQSPNLKVEQADVCFHVFLKLVAVTLQRLAARDAVKDIKNLVFRILPNHNRQYLKEQDVYQHELSALQNHHDLFCTLFWAAPSEQRPHLSHLEGLVVPVSSHKEACLISLRAWSQLARFLVSKGDATSFYPFFRWQARMFQQLLHQYNSVDQDIQQQLQELTKEAGPVVNEGLMRVVIASNKAATMEVLRASVAKSLDVAKRARSAELALLSGNYLQLEQVYEHFAVPTADSPWSMYRDAAAIIETLLDRIELLFVPGTCHTSERSSLDNTIMLVDDNLSAVFFRLARRMARNDGELSAFLCSSSTAANVLTNTISVAGKLSAMLVRCGTMRLSQCFKPGRHCLFNGLPIHLNLHQRQYLPLFLSEVLKRGALDLSDISISTLQLWLECLVKPRKYLMFEDQFGIALRCQGASFVPDTVGQFVALSRYETNRNHFKQTLSWMRQMSQIGSDQEKKMFLSQCTSALTATMKQIEVDLAANVSDEDEHRAYVNFVRHIISLIKSYGGGICTVPSFFYQVSREYSPPELDPQLLVAQVRSYGIRLSEGDNRAAPQLFSFLYHNFKQAVLHCRLSREVLMLQKGMRQESIMAFSLGTMMPAILQATLAKPEAFVLFDVFCEAACLRLTKPSAPFAMQGEGIRSIVHLIWATANWAVATRTKTFHRLQPEQVHLLRRMFLVLNSLQPMIESLSFLQHVGDSWADLEDGLRCIHSLAKKATHYLELHYLPGSGTVDGMGLLGDRSADVFHENPMIRSLANELVHDIRKTWQNNGGIITIQAPFRTVTSTQSPTDQGIHIPSWDMDKLVRNLAEQLHLWTDWWRRCKT